MAGWYARFIENYAEMKLPINKLTFKGQKWEWGEEQQTPSQNIKDALTRAPVLVRPDFSKPFIIQCDASGSTLGALVLLEGNVLRRKEFRASVRAVPEVQGGADGSAGTNG